MFGSFGWMELLLILIIVLIIFGAGKIPSSVRDWAKPLRDSRRASMKPTPLMSRRRRLSPRPRSHHRWRRDSLLNRGRLSTSNRSSKGD